MKDTKSQRRITVADMAPHIHSFLPHENKTDKLVKWLTNWIVLSLECGKIKPNDLLPLKADLACHIGVSQGTIQNVFRIVEDAGYIESKQRIGTLIKDTKKNPNFEKLTSKRELAVELIKKYLMDNNFSTGDRVPSTRNLSDILGLSNATIRMAFTSLVNTGIIEKQDKTFIVTNIEYNIEKIENKTLVEKLAEKVRLYIGENFQTGDKLPSNKILAKQFKVSIKTIHDTFRLLSKEGIILTKRGQYGTIVTAESSQQAEFYQYEKFEQKIKQFIATNCEVGNKLPAIKTIAKEFETSEKTIKKALDNLAEDGYVTFVRGRYGGTFVTDIPQASNEAYKWLAITPEYITNMEN